MRTFPVPGAAVMNLAEARSDSKRRLLLLIVQGLMWIDRRSFCFLLLRPGGPSRRLRFFVTVATGGTVCELLACCALPLRGTR